MSRPFLGALVSTAFLSACHARSNPMDRQPSAATQVREARADVAASAVQSIEAGELERARELLDDLVLAERMDRARRELASGAPEDALTAIDEALAMAPEDPAVRLLKADASLRLAEAKIAAGGASGGLIEGSLGDALDFYLGAGESAHALFGASRAAWLLGRADEGLAYARRGLVELAPEEEGAAALGELAQRPHRIYAEQVFTAYARARAEETEASRALALESEDALTRLLGREMSDPWAWQRLSDLYEWESRPSEARRVCQLGLKHTPEDAGLLERLARTSASLAGPGATAELLETHLVAHGPIPAARWHLAVARFQVALAGLKAEPRELASAPFEAAEAEFRALGLDAPEFAAGALGYQIVSRLARGWCAFHAGDLAQAASTFLGLNELAERGIEWTLPGELENGIQGLFMVADAHGAREDKLAAGEVFEALHHLQPDQYLWANNAGFFLRDAAFELELEGRRLCRAARGRLTNPEALAELRARAGLASEAAGSAEECAAFARAADERLARAREIMERSWQAYRPAAELAPRDVRVVNDAALVLVYYLHHDLEWAEQALLRCVELGGPEVEAKRALLAVEESPERASALEAELALLTEAWGDAHQNLGVLAWVHRKDAASAARWLEKSLEIWPSRPPVKHSLLPQVRGELAPEEEDTWDLLNWAQPCKIP